MRKVKLVFREGSSDKFYEMEERMDRQFKVTYGRSGTAGTSIIYPISDWNRKYNEKVNKGYIDVSEEDKSFEDIFANLDKLIAKMEEKERLAQLSQ